MSQARQLPDESQVKLAQQAARGERERELQTTSRKRHYGKLPEEEEKEEGEEEEEG